MQKSNCLFKYVSENIGRRSMIDPEKLLIPEIVLQRLEDPLVTTVADLKCDDP